MAVSFGFDGIVPKPRMPAVGETVNGEPFSMPRDSQAMTIHVPALVGAAATVKIQTLDPMTKDESSPTWRDVNVFNLAAGGVQALSAIPENTAVTFPTAALGSGVLRLVASEDQSGTPVYIPIVISRL